MQNIHKPIIKIILIILIVLVIILGLIYGWQRLIKGSTRPNGGVTKDISWEECVRNPKSIIQQTYPAICTAPDGRQVSQPLSEEEQKRLEEERRNLGIE